MKPSRETTEILLYVLAYVLRKHSGILVHELVALSNHYHLVLTDTARELPKFMQELDSLVARALNARWQMFGTFWEHEQYSAPVLPEDGDLFDKCVYALCNACAAGLVALPHDWKGLSSWSWTYGKPIKIRRPGRFFSSQMPDELEIVLTRPAIMQQLSDVELRRAIRRATIERANWCAQKRRASGRGVLGMDRVLRQSHHSDPTKADKRFAPRVEASSRSRWSRAEVEQRNHALRRWYRAALDRFRAGERGVEFPPDTYLMRVRFGCACASP